MTGAPRCPHSRILVRDRAGGRQHAVATPATGPQPGNPMTDQTDISQLSPARRAALYGALTALALVAGYVEVLVPLPVTVPGVKLGLGNAIVLFALVRLGARPAAFLMLAKVLCTTLLFANPQMLVFSLAGGVLSWAVMAAAVQSRLFSVVATSILGGIAHNAGQLLMVALLLSPQVALINAPVLAAAGTICGAAIGVLVRAVLAAVPGEVRHG